MRVKSYDNSPDKLVTRIYNLTREYFGPLDYRSLDASSVRTFYASLNSFSISFNLADTVPIPSHTSTLSSACYIWKINVWYR